MDIQHIFYLIGSIALTLFGLFLLAALIIAIYVQRKITRAVRIAELIGLELRSLLTTGKSYLKYQSTRTKMNVLGFLLRFLRNL